MIVAITIDVDDPNQKKFDLKPAFHSYALHKKRGLKPPALLFIVFSERALIYQHDCCKQSELFFNLLCK